VTGGVPPSGGVRMQAGPARHAGGGTADGATVDGSTAHGGTANGGTADRSTAHNSTADVAPGDAVYELVVNGVARPVEGARTGDSLLHVLRDRLGLAGAKNACEQGECGSCSVLVDGMLVCACLELAQAAVGCEITTVEGLAPAGAEPGDAALAGDVLTDVQQAMVEAGGVQCGFCTPGFVVAIHDLLERVAAPTPVEVREALAGNLCRCTGYGRILAAVEKVVTVRTSAAMTTADGSDPAS
jgi:carbon-monoxide dehydrogenase small subunit